MIITVLILSILSSAVINEKEKSIIYSRISIQSLLLASFILYNNIFIKSLEGGIGIYGGMFTISALTQSFNLFIMIIASIILILTSFNRASIYSIILHVKRLNRMVYYTYNNPNKVYRVFEDTYIINKKSNNNTGILPLDEKYSDLIPKIIGKIKRDVKKNGQLEIIEYALITIFIISGAIFLMSTTDLISMFLAIELQSYGLYILCTLYRDSESSTNSGLTYFLLGCMSSCFILFGSGLFYVNSGTTNLENIYIINSIDSILYAPGSGFGSIYEWYLPNYITMSLVIIIVGFLFKISAAPFHFWSPDVYDGIPTVVTTFVAIIPKISIFVFILQLVINAYISPIYISDIYYADGVHIEYSYLQHTWGWKDIILVSSLLSLIIGSLLGLTQHRIKRLFAYSTISHVGFILLALSVSTMESVQGYVFYIIQYTISNVNAFFILIAMGFALNTKQLNKSDSINGISEHNRLPDSGLAEINYSPIQLVSQLKGYFYINSYIAISLSITLFSFVGIPPLIGFFAKQMVLSAALAEGYVFITLIAVITSVIGAVYYLNIIKNMFFSDYSSKNENIYGKMDSTNYETNHNSIFKLIVLSSKSFTPMFIGMDEAGKTKEYVEHFNIHKINSALNITISILTFVILTFIFMPNEWLRVASILSVTLFKL